MYKQLKDKNAVLVENCILRIADSASIPFDPANTDYQAYLQWLAEGNTPEPAEEQQ